MTGSDRILRFRVHFVHPKSKHILLPYPQSEPRVLNQSTPVKQNKQGMEANKSLFVILNQL